MRLSGNTSCHSAIVRSSFVPRASGCCVSANLRFISATISSCSSRAISRSNAPRMSARNSPEPPSAAYSESIDPGVVSSVSLS